MKTRTLRRLLHRFRRELTAVMGGMATRLASALHVHHGRHRYHFARIHRRH